MQLNIYVPAPRADVLKRLAEFSERTGRPRNEVVLAALEQYLTKEAPLGKLGVFSLGTVYSTTREDLYEDRLLDPDR